MRIGDKVVVLGHLNMRGEIVGITRDGRLEVDLGEDMGVWIFHPQALELEERDDLWWQ